MDVSAKATYRLREDSEQPLLRCVVCKEAWEQGDVIVGYVTSADTEGDVPRVDISFAHAPCVEDA